MIKLMVEMNYLFLLFSLLSLGYGYKLNLWGENLKTKYIIIYFILVSSLYTLPQFTTATFTQVEIVSRILSIFFMMWMFIHIIGLREKVVKEENEGY